MPSQETKSDLQVGVRTLQHVVRSIKWAQTSGKRCHFPGNTTRSSVGRRGWESCTQEKTMERPEWAWREVPNRCQTAVRVHLSLSLSIYGESQQALSFSGTGRNNTVLAESITEMMDPESQAGHDRENMADGPRYIRKTPERQDLSLLLIQPQSQNHAQYRAINSYSRCPVKTHCKNELKKIRGPNNVDKWLTGIIEELSMKNRRLWSK